MTYHVLGLLADGFLTIRANDRPHILVFHDEQLALRCMDAALLVWPDLAPITLLKLPAPNRADTVEFLRSRRKMPTNLNLLFADDLLFLDLVEDLARLSRARGSMRNIVRTMR